MNSRSTSRCESEAKTWRRKGEPSQSDFIDSRNVTGEFEFVQKKTLVSYVKTMLWIGLGQDTYHVNKILFILLITHDFKKVVEATTWDKALFQCCQDHSCWITLWNTCEVLTSLSCIQSDVEHGITYNCYNALWMQDSLKVFPKFHSEDVFRNTPAGETIMDDEIIKPLRLPNFSFSALSCYPSPCVFQKDPSWAWIREAKIRPGGIVHCRIDFDDGYRNLVSNEGSGRSSCP